MPAMYVVGRTAAGTNLTIALVASIATARPSVHQLIIGSDSAPADIATARASTQVRHAMPGCISCGLSASV